jgi:orotidine-5'-phosphate decarboxylase
MPIPERMNPTFASGRSAEPGRMVGARKRLIVALDMSSTEVAEDMVRQLEGACQWFKVGLELFSAAGPAVVESLAARGHSVFLDLKFHDIPNTVAGAVRSAAALGARMMTVHAAGGQAMLAAARAALDGVADPPQLLAVTVLTSMDAEQLKATGVKRSPAEQVELLARMGWEAGIRGFVCSPQEVKAVRAMTGAEGVLVVPGIRPAGTEVPSPSPSHSDDQKRIATPAFALSAGASYLVVGRPITQAPDPAKAAEAILQEMAQAILM